MANSHSPAAGSQGASGTGQYENGLPAAAGPGEDDQRSGQGGQYIELPEHQGVLIDYIPPRGGLRSEIGDLEAEDSTGDPQS